MANELVTWVPAINTWDVPGSTLLSGSVDLVNNPTRIDAGPSNHYSATPTISEINSGSGWNQVVALTRRRILRYNLLFGTTQSVSFLNYFDSDIIIKDNSPSSKNILTLYSLINQLRSLEGFSTYTFPTSEVSTGKLIKGSHLAHARKALSIRGILTKITSQSSNGVKIKRWAKFDKPYNTTINGPLITDVASLTDYGKDNFTSAGSFFQFMIRSRGLWSIPIPDWITDLDSADIYAMVSSKNTNLEPFDLDLYTSNTDDSAYSTPNVVNNINNFRGSVNSSNPLLVFPNEVLLATLTEAEILAKVGQRLSTIIGTRHEMAGTGNGIPSPFNSSQDSDISNSYLKIYINFGS